MSLKRAQERFDNSVDPRYWEDDGMDDNEEEEED